MIKAEVTFFFLSNINFLYDFPCIQGASWISFSLNSTNELPSSFQPEIRQGRVAFYLKPGREELYSIIYLMCLWRALDLAKQKF